MNNFISGISGILSFRRSISAKIIITAAVILILALFALGLIIYYSISERHTSLVEQRNIEVAKILEKEISTFLNGAGESLLRISKDYGLRSNNQIRVVTKSIFVQELEETTFFSRLYFFAVDQEKIIEPTKELPPGYQPDAEVWFKQAKEQKELTWTSSFSSTDTNEFNLKLSIPVFDYSNNLMGVLVGDISLPTIAQILSWQIGQSGYVYLIDQAGKVIVNPSGEQFAPGFSLKSVLDLERLQQEKNITYQYQNDNYLVSFVPLNLIGGAILAQVPTSEAFAAQEIVIRQVVTGSLITVMILIVAIFFMFRIYLIKPLFQIIQKMKMVATGQLNIDMEHNRSDEIGVLLDTFGKMVQQLRELISSMNYAAAEVTNTSEQLKKSIANIGAASAQITESISSVSVGTDQQALDIEKVNNEFAGLSHGLKTLNKSNQIVEKLSNKMNQASGKGQLEMEKISGQMNKINLSISKVADGIAALQKISGEIDGILEIINNISKQTNLLALNAAIEAARAGEAGKGFSVVADEIRHLAEDTTRNADKIKELINDIKEETEVASSRMQQGNKEIDLGEDVVKFASTAFQEIELTVQDLTQAINNTSAVLDGASKNNRLIAGNMQKIAGISQETLANATQVVSNNQQQNNSVQQIVQVTDNLLGMAVKLQNRIKRFDLA